MRGAVVIRSSIRQMPEYEPNKSPATNGPADVRAYGSTSPHRKPRQAAMALALLTRSGVEIERNSSR